MQESEIGLFSLEIDGKTFKLLPSLRNMAKLANSSEILDLYSTIHDQHVNDYVRVDIGRDVLLACSDSPDIEQYLVETQDRKPLISENTISINDQVLVAAALMRHGIAGVNRPEYAGSKENKNSKGVDKFDVNKIVADAMIHFGLSKSEALDITMSEFCYLLAAKFPPDSETKRNDSPSLDDHKAAMKALMEKNNNG